LVLVFILFFVGGVIISILTRKWLIKHFYESPVLETVWTFLPGLILICLGIPTLQLLYDIEINPSSDLTLKRTGHQWYWSYDYTDFPGLEFDRYLTPFNDLKEGDFRLLERDNRVVLPFNSPIRLITTRGDVLHSWAVPSLGVKIDSNPGRINQVFFFSSYPGLFYGQCSEICGANHSFMPISIEITTLDNFLGWAQRV